MADKDVEELPLTSRNDNLSSGPPHGKKRKIEEDVPFVSESESSDEDQKYDHIESENNIKKQKFDDENDDEENGREENDEDGDEEENKDDTDAENDDEDVDDDEDDDDDDDVDDEDEDEENDEDGEKLTDEDDSESCNDEDDSDDGESEEGEEEDDGNVDDTHECLSDLETEKCPVCLNPFEEQDVGTPESCDHTFCLECILEWSKNVNTCPVDRQLFHSILVRHSYHGTVIRRIEVDDRTVEEDEDDGDEPTYCEVCGRCDREDRLLLCDGCDSGYHCECLDPPLESIPIEEWFCPECTTDDKEELAEIISSEEDELLNLLDDQTPDLSISRLRQRPMRAIARTRVSERVRANVQRARERARERAGWEDNEAESARRPTASTERPRSTARARSSSSARPTVRRKTKKTTRKRKPTKRKGAKRKTRKKKTTTSKTGTPKKTKKRRRTRKTKKRKRKTSSKKRISKVKAAVPMTIRGRIANKLGLVKTRTGSTVPDVKGRATRSLDYRRSEIGVASLSLTGDDTLLYHDEEAGTSSQTAAMPVTAGSSRRHVKSLSRSALCSHQPVAKPMARRREKQAKEADSVKPAPVLDLLGSIMQGQTLLHMPSSNVTISRDGSLKPHLPSGNPKTTKPPLETNKSQDNKCSEDPCDFSKTQDKHVDSENERNEQPRNKQNNFATVETNNTTYQKADSNDVTAEDSKDSKHVCFTSDVKKPEEDIDDIKEEKQIQKEENEKLNEGEKNDNEHDNNLNEVEIDSASDEIDDRSHEDDLQDVERQNVTLQVNTSNADDGDRFQSEVNEQKNSDGDNAQSESNNLNTIVDTETDTIVTGEIWGVKTETSDVSFIDTVHDIEEEPNDKDSGSEDNLEHDNEDGNNQGDGNEYAPEHNNDEEENMIENSGGEEDDDRGEELSEEHNESHSVSNEVVDSLSDASAEDLINKMEGEESAEEFDTEQLANVTEGEDSVHDDISGTQSNDEYSRDGNEDVTAVSNDDERDNSEIETSELQIDEYRAGEEGEDQEKTEEVEREEGEMVDENEDRTDKENTREMYKRQEIARVGSEDRETEEGEIIERKTGRRRHEKERSRRNRSRVIKLNRDSGRKIVSELSHGRSSPSYAAWESSSPRVPISELPRIPKLKRHSDDKAKDKYVSKDAAKSKSRKDHDRKDARREKYSRSERNKEAEKKVERIDKKEKRSRSSSRDRSKGKKHRNSSRERSERVSWKNEHGEDIYRKVERTERDILISVRNTDRREKKEDKRRRDEDANKIADRWRDDRRRGDRHSRDKTRDRVSVPKSTSPSLRSPLASTSLERRRRDEWRRADDKAIEMSRYWDGGKYREREWDRYKVRHGDVWRVDRTLAWGEGRREIILPKETERLRFDVVQDRFRRVESSSVRSDTRESRYKVKDITSRDKKDSVEVVKKKDSDKNKEDLKRKDLKRTADKRKAPPKEKLEKEKTKDRASLEQSTKIKGQIESSKKHKIATVAKEPRKKKNSKNIKDKIDKLEAMKELVKAELEKEDTEIAMVTNPKETTIVVGDNETKQTKLSEEERMAKQGLKLKRSLSDSGGKKSTKKRKRTTSSELDERTSEEADRLSIVDDWLSNHVSSENVSNSATSLPDLNTSSVADNSSGVLSPESEKGKPGMEETTSSDCHQERKEYDPFEPTGSPSPPTGQDRENTFKKPDIPSQKDDFSPPPIPASPVPVGVVPPPPPSPQHLQTVAVNIVTPGHPLTPNVSVPLNVQHIQHTGLPMSIPPPTMPPAVNFPSNVSNPLISQVRLMNLLPALAPPPPHGQFGNQFSETQQNFAPSLNNQNSNSHNKTASMQSNHHRSEETKVAKPATPPDETMETVDMEIDMSPGSDTGKLEINPVIDEDVESSAVELYNKGSRDRYLQKLHHQERVVEEVKLAIKPFYQKKLIDKVEYKDILRKAVNKICHSRSGVINPVKIKGLVEGYVKKYQEKRKFEIKSKLGRPSVSSSSTSSKTKRSSSHIKTSKTDR